MNEIEIIKGLLNLLKPHKVYADGLPLHFDFKKGYGIYYIVDTVTDGYYKDEYNLEVHLIGLDKITLIGATESIHAMVNKKHPTNDSWIVPKNVRRNHLKEEDGKDHFILEYYIKNYGGR